MGSYPAQLASASVASVESESDLKQSSNDDQKADVAADVKPELENLPLSQLEQHASVRGVAGDTVAATDDVVDHKTGQIKTIRSDAPQSSAAPALVGEDENQTSSISGAWEDAWVDILVLDLVGQPVCQTQVCRSDMVEYIRTLVASSCTRPFNLVSDSEILTDQIEIGTLQSEPAQQIVLHVALIDYQFSPHPAVTLLHDARVVDATSNSGGKNVFLDQTFEVGVNTVMFRVEKAGISGFAVGIADDEGMARLGGDRQLGSQSWSWGWTAYDGAQSSVEEVGGWQAMSDKWDAPGTEITLVVDHVKGEVSFAIGSSCPASV